MKKDEILEKLHLHKLWVESKKGGKKADFSGEDLSDVNFSFENLAHANFSGANLSRAVFYSANLADVDFSGANLSGAGLSYAYFSGANLAGAKLPLGFFSSKEEEMAEAERILEIIESGGGELEMARWHTSADCHCLAGWCKPNLEYPAKEAAFLLPTLAKYFHEKENKKALAALRRVARGEESIWD